MGTERAALDFAEKSGYEKEWANNEARLKLSSEDRAIWNCCKCTIRPHVYFDKIFIVWSVKQGVPEILDVLTVESVDATFEMGIWVHAASKLTKAKHVITHTPRRLPGLDVFVWVPFFNEIRFASNDWNDVTAPRSLRVSLCFKTRDNKQRLVEGQHYVTELHVFRDQWPQYASTRF